MHVSVDVDIYVHEHCVCFTGSTRCVHTHTRAQTHTHAHTHLTGLQRRIRIAPNQGDYAVRMEQLCRAASEAGTDLHNEPVGLWEMVRGWSRPQGQPVSVSCTGSKEPGGRPAPAPTHVARCAPRRVPCTPPTTQEASCIHVYSGSRTFWSPKRLRNPVDALFHSEPRGQRFVRPDMGHE